MENACRRDNMDHSCGNSIFLLEIVNFLMYYLAAEWYGVAKGKKNVAFIDIGIILIRTIPSIICKRKLFNTQTNQDQE